MTKIRRRKKRREASSSPSPSPSPPSSPSSKAAFVLASSLSFSASSLLHHSATLLLQNCLSLFDDDTCTASFSSVSSSLARILQKYSPSSYNTLPRKTKLALIVSRPSLFTLDILNLLELLLLPRSSLQPSQFAAAISDSDAFHLVSHHKPLYLSFVDTVCRISSPRKHFHLLSDSPILRVLEAWNDCVVNLIVQGRENVAKDMVQNLPPHLKNLLSLLLRSPPTDSRTHAEVNSHFVKLNAARNRVLQGSVWMEEDIESEDVKSSDVLTHEDGGSSWSSLELSVEELWLMMFGFANWREYATKLTSDPAAIEYLAWLLHPEDGYSRVFLL